MLVVDYLTQDLMLYEHPTRATEWDRWPGSAAAARANMIRFALDRREPLRVQWEQFLAALRAGAPAPVSGRDGAGRAVHRARDQRRRRAPRDRRAGLPGGAACRRLT